jgi:hypothetical protein
MSRFCIQCGSQLADVARFCGNCGAEVADVVATPAHVQSSAYHDAATMQPYAPEPVVAEPAVEYADAVPVESLRYSADESEYADDIPKNGPNWLLIGGGVGILLFLLLYYLIFIRDDVQGNPARPAPVAKQVVESDKAEAIEFFAVAQANIRDKATTQGSAITGKLARGSSARGTLIVGEDGTSNWLKLDDDAGFVSANNLSEVAPPEITKLLGDKIWTANKALDIYTQPDRAAVIYDRVSAGTTLTLYGLTANDFIEIKLRKGGVGYLANGAMLLEQAPVLGKPLAISFNPSSCSFGGELQVEFARLERQVRSAYEAAEKRDYPDEAARERALIALETKSNFQKLERSFAGLSVTGIGQQRESQSIYFADAPDKVIAAFRGAGLSVGKDGSFPSAEFSAGIGAASGQARNLGKAELSCGV